MKWVGSVGEEIKEGVGVKYSTKSMSAMPLMAVPLSRDPLLINSVYCDGGKGVESEREKNDYNGMMGGENEVARESRSSRGRCQ